MKQRTLNILMSDADKQLAIFLFCLFYDLNQQVFIDQQQSIFCYFICQFQVSITVITSCLTRFSFKGFVNKKSDKINMITKMKTIENRISISMVQTEHQRIPVVITTKTVQTNMLNLSLCYIKRCHSRSI